MASQEFVVLYTHQKMKKSKVWQDGILKISFSRNKATLYDDKGQCLESLFLKQSEVKPGDDLESDRYLITIEDVKNAENILSNLEVRTEVPKLNVQVLKPSNKPKPCLPTGLKRKFTGFQGPRQVPKKMAAIENGESTASLLSKESCPTFSSLFYCTPPLFSTTGKKNRSSVMPSDCNSVLDPKNSNTSDMSISLLLSTASITSNQKGFFDEDDHSFFNSATNKSDSSLDPEYVKEDCLTTRGSAASQNVRSKEQILALLKSKSTTVEVVEHFSRGHLTEEIKGSLEPQCIIGMEEEITEMSSTKNIPQQCHLENDVRKRSRWDIYLPKSLSGSSSDVSDSEGKSKDQDGNLDLGLKGPFEQKVKHPFATDSEKKVVYMTDNQIDNDDQTTCNQKINFQASSLCQSELGANLPVLSNINEHQYLSKSKSEMLFNNNYPKCIKGSVLTRENVQELDKTGVPERENHLKLSSQPEWEYTQLQKDFSCISNNLAVSDNLPTFSKSRAENENINTNTDLNSKPETFLEVTFNLDNSDISDSEEESQNGNIFSPGSEHCLKKISSEDKMCAERKFEDSSNSQEDDNEHLPHLTTINSSPPAKFPIKKTLSSQIHTETSVDFDRIGNGNETSFLFNTNLPEVENVEEEMTVDTSDFETLSRGTKWDSSYKQTDDILIYGNSHCNRSVHPTVTDYDHVPPQTEKQFTEVCYSSDRPEPLNLYQDSIQQVLQENQDEILTVPNESFESLQTSLKDDEENAFVATIPKEKERKSCKPKVISPMQKMSTLSPDSTFPLSPRNEDIMIKIPEESLKAKTLSGVEKFNCSEKVNVQSLHRVRTPLITLPPVNIHSLSENCLHRMDSKVQKSFGSPILGSYEESAGSPVSYFGLEDRNRETSVSQKSGEETPVRLPFSPLVSPQSKQSKWLKYQSVSPGDSIIPHGSDVRVNESFFAASASGIGLEEPEGHHNGAAKKSPKDSVHLEMIKGMLHQQQADFYHRESVFRKKALFQHLEQTSQTEEIQKMLSQSAHSGFSVTGSTQEINASALSFPSGQISKCACVPKRQIRIPAVFQSPAQYKQVFTTSLIEHLNILLFEVSKRLHQVLLKVDISFYTSMKAEKKKKENSKKKSL